MSYFPDSVSLEPMNPTIKAQWLEALRSGEYKQGREYLRQSNKDTVLYCCLGVLCDLHRKATGTYQWEVPYSEFSVYSYCGLKSCLSSEVSDWAKIRSGTMLDNTADDVLATANDNGADFPTIANWIEANL